MPLREQFNEDHIFRAVLLGEDQTGHRLVIAGISRQLLVTTAISRVSAGCELLPSRVSVTRGEQAGASIIAEVSHATVPTGTHRVPVNDKFAQRCPILCAEPVDAAFRLVGVLPASQLE